jgi:hypothetical protein
MEVQVIEVPNRDPAGPATEPDHRLAVNGRAVRTTVRWVVGLILMAHGSIHLLGATKGFRWAEVTQLAEPISAALGVAWLVAAVVMMATGALLLARVRWWWTIGAAAVVVSQSVIITSWSDAKAGTIVNLVLLLGVIYGWASQGPKGAYAEYRRRALGVLGAARSEVLVTEADLAHLPAPVAAYIRRAGAVGEPHVKTFLARFHGRIRGDPTKPWMTFTGEQVNSFGRQPSRLFFMDAEMFGLPVEVLHKFEDGSATMRVRACSLFTMVDASGPEMDRAETVTLFNDLCILAPAALVDAPVTWQLVDDHHVLATCTYGVNTIGAELTFNDDHELIDFYSDDRMAVSTDGTTFKPQPWSTPLCTYRDFGSCRVATVGEARWHAPEGEFAYLEYELDDIVYNAPNLEHVLRGS